MEVPSSRPGGVHRVDCVDEVVGQHMVLRLGTNHQPEYNNCSWALHQRYTVNGRINRYRYNVEKSQSYRTV